MNLTDLYTHEYEEFASEILRLFEIENQDTTKTFRFLKNKMSTKIFSKKFSKISNFKPQIGNIEIAALILEHLKNSKTEKDQLLKQVDELRHTIESKEIIFVRHSSELKDQIQLLTRRNQALEDQVESMQKKMEASNLQAEAEIEKMKEKIRKKGEELDEALVIRALDQSKIDSQQMEIKRFNEQLSGIRVESDRIKADFSFFCNIVSEQKGNTEYLKKGLLREAGSRFKRLWSGNRIRERVFEFLDEGDFKRLQGTSRKIKLLLSNDRVVNGVRLARQLEGNNSLYTLQST